MAKVIGEIIIDIEKCKGCELCIDSCNKESIGLSQTINSKGYQFAIKINDLCNGCGSCAIVCPDAVITVYRQVNKEKRPVKVIELQD